MDVLIEILLAVALGAAGVLTVTFVISSILLLAIDLDPGQDGAVNAIDPEPTLAGVLPFVEPAPAVSPSRRRDLRPPCAA